MSKQLNFLIIDGYNKQSRADLAAAGMKLSCNLYLEMLRRELPQAHADILFPSDPDASFPTGVKLADYDGILWTGSNATIYVKEPRVTNQIELAKEAYKVGIPQFGTCWGLQMAAVAAGGECQANPRGREMGLARRIRLTDAGKNHPLMQGRNPVYEAFISHDDEVTKVPAGSLVLATNDFTSVQAIAVKHGLGEFWAIQYHPEYNLHELARLIIAREQKLMRMGFYRTSADLNRHVDMMETLYYHPSRKDLRWNLVVEDDVLSTPRRTLEFRNWVNQMILSGAAGK
jgi:GMP synthase (glutamine-hydrolysing)